MPVPQKQITTVIPLVEQVCQDQPEWKQYGLQMAEAQSLSGMVWVAMQMGLFIARQLVQQE